MKKSDKKIDNRICQVLTEVCESALKSIDGFQWLTHTVNYGNFPASLHIVCVFDNDQSQEQFVNDAAAVGQIQESIRSHLASIDIKTKNISKHISFDNEHQCNVQHQGNWASRLSRRH